MIAILMLLMQVPDLPGGACTACGIRAHIDSPKAVSDADPALTGVPQTFAIAGWGFECVSGRPVDRVDVFLANGDGFYRPVPWWLTEFRAGAKRPDVFWAFRSACPEATVDEGWHLILFAGAVPSGTQALLINVWSGPFRQQFARTVVVK